MPKPAKFARNSAKSIKSAAGKSNRDQGEAPKGKPAKKSSGKSSASERYEEVEELGTISGDVKVRMQRTDGLLGLDIRKFVDTEKYTGFTRQGFFFSEIKTLKTLRKHIEKAIKMMEEEE